MQTLGFRNKLLIPLESFSTTLCQYPKNIDSNLGQDQNFIKMTTNPKSFKLSEATNHFRHVNSVFHDEPNITIQKTDFGHIN